MRGPLSYDVPVLLLNQPNIWRYQQGQQHNFERDLRADVSSVSHRTSL